MSEARPTRRRPRERRDRSRETSYWPLQLQEASGEGRNEVGVARLANGVVGSR